MLLKKKKHIAPTSTACLERWFICSWQVKWFMRPFVFLQSACFSVVAAMWGPARRAPDQRFLWKLLPCNSTIPRSYRRVTSLFGCSFFPEPAAALCYVHIHRHFWILGGTQVSVLFVYLNYVCLWCHCSVDRQRKLCFSSLVPHPHSPQFPRPEPAAARPQDVSPNTDPLLSPFIPLTVPRIIPPFSFPAWLSVTPHLFSLWLLLPLTRCQLNCSSPQGCAQRKKEVYPATVGNPLCPHT